MSEVELKLRAAARDFDRLRGALPRFGAVRRRARTRRLSTVYYETPDFALAKGGVALRVRRVGERRIQTVKTAARPGALERGEWDCAIEDDEPDLKALARPPLAQLFPAHALATLRPIFRSEIQRTEVDIQPDDATRVSVAFDEGRVVADGAAQPVSEVELELRVPERPRHQQVGLLYELALELQRVAPVTISTTSKAARGYRLVNGTVPQATKAPPLELPRECSVADGIRAVLRACLGHLLANQEPASAEGEAAVEGIHQMRVAVRRLRTALRIFEPFIASTEAPWMDSELRWLGRQLGEARDLDVLVATTLPLASERCAVKREVAVVAKTAQRRRQEIRTRTQAMLRTPRYTTMVLALGAWIEEDRWSADLGSDARQRLRAPLSESGGKLLGRLARKARKTGRGITRLDPKRRHKLRRSLKRLRYGAEFLASLYRRKAFKRYRRALADLQDVLGDLNDFATARRLLPAAAGGSRRAAAAASLQRCFDALAEKRLGALHDAWDRFRRVKPFWS